MRAYWDATGTESMVHNNEGIKGIEVLGSDIVQMHLKNNREPLMEVPGLVDWSKAWPAIRRSGFEGWFVIRDAARESRGVHRGDEKECGVGDTESGASSIDAVKMPA